MIGFASRFVGLWFVAGALVAVVVDAAKTLALSQLTVTPLGATLFAIAPSALVGAQSFVQQHIEPAVGGWVWDPLIQWLLLLPAWGVLGFLGFLLTWLGRRRRVRLAYA
ncbi:MAG TPA: hypothetical protein VG894_00995 [Bauldia sp.]|nr:hypothetical protein [Bauldia sp.]